MWGRMQASLVVTSAVALTVVMLGFWVPISWRSSGGGIDRVAKQCFHESRLFLSGFAFVTQCFEEIRLGRFINCRIDKAIHGELEWRWSINTSPHPAPPPHNGMAKTLDTMSATARGLIFTNLVDFDQQYGHRNDIEGYGRALEEFDQRAVFVGRGDQFPCPPVR